MIAAGAQGFVTKPFALAKLREAIDRAIEIRHLADRVEEADGVNGELRAAPFSNLALRTDTGGGEIVFLEGDMVSAQAGDLRDEAAFAALTQWDSGTYEFRCTEDPVVDDEEDATTPVVPLLLHAEAARA